MPEKSIQIPAPLVPHPDTMADPLLAIEAEGGVAIIVYCPRNLCGAIYNMEMKVWGCQSPLHFETFLAMLDDMDYTPGDEAGRAMWKARIKEIIREQLARLAPAAND